MNHVPPRLPAFLSSREPFRAIDRGAVAAAARRILCWETFALAILLLALADAYTTELALKRGKSEQNPIMKSLIAWSPWTAMCLKGIGTTLAILVTIRRPVNERPRALVILLGIMATTVLNNTCLLLWEP